LGERAARIGTGEASTSIPAFSARTGGLLCFTVSERQTDRDTERRRERKSEKEKQRESERETERHSTRKRERARERGMRSF